MSSEFERSADEEIADVRMGRPHVVVLGAGASRATCESGDKSGKALPLMLDFVDIVGLRPLLERWGVDPNQNFEEVFSALYESGERARVEELQRLTREYFGRLALPDTPTIYDHLVLSLRDKDLIARAEAFFDDHQYDWSRGVMNLFLITIEKMKDQLYFEESRLEILAWKIHDAYEGVLR